MHEALGSEYECRLDTAVQPVRLKRKHFAGAKGGAVDVVRSRVQRICGLPHRSSRRLHDPGGQAELPGARRQLHPRLYKSQRLRGWSDLRRYQGCT